MVMGKRRMDFPSGWRLSEEEISRFDCGAMFLEPWRRVSDLRRSCVALYLARPVGRDHESAFMTPESSKPIQFDTSAKGRWRASTVLDLSRLVAGNMLSLQLADFGAEVIKIEPLEGDPLRHWRDGGEELFWKTYSRNKMSVVLELRNVRAKEALLRLVETADVLVESFRPGTLEKMGLAPACSGCVIRAWLWCAYRVSARQGLMPNCRASGRWSRR
jgi:hypothetical protein